MSTRVDGAGGRGCWFVGAAHGGGTIDQTPRFVKEGIWENGYQDKYLELVKSVQVGDPIAIKSTYTRKHDLPFDPRDHRVSVMAIKATGVVKANPGDGRLLQVDWAPVEPPREWYFYTFRTTITRVLPGDWAADALIRFTFEGEQQDIDRFRNAPYWRDRFGDEEERRRSFDWTRFYEEVSDKLVGYRERRGELLEAIHAWAEELPGLSYLEDRYEDGTTGPLQDVCPFTVLGIFNRGTTLENRRAIAGRLADLLGVTQPVPKSFDGVPILNNQRSWFFRYADQRGAEDIDLLWDVFSAALALEGSDQPENRTAFVAAYNAATSLPGVRWNLTMGLYWSRPWFFATLDSQSQTYIRKKLGIELGEKSGKLPDGADYLHTLETIAAHFAEDAYPVHSFPELSLAAWHFKDSPPPGDSSAPEEEPDEASEDVPVPAPLQPYSVDDILADGCFLERARLEQILDRLQTKKNLILQGPPGTGKTWLAKRLSFALMGERDESRLRAVQFHPTLSYEDFVRGWRPSGDGKLSLVDGPFLEMASSAASRPAVRHVVVIEEINRGHPAQIFGEMLTLLEADKRTPNEALELSYRRYEGERVYVPDNLYVVGTMNIADRSLAIVDFALRRRFAFIDLEPTLGEVWREWVSKKAGIDLEILATIEERILALNKEIAADPSLGRQFCLGHSFVTPPENRPIGDPLEWFKQVVHTEIGPLLDEYWFDVPEKAEEARSSLIAGL